MNRTPPDKLNDPDHNVQQPKTIDTGRAGSLPLHWNSPPGTLAGARYGANPREETHVMTYKEFMETHKNNSNTENNKS
jgi:hypothetical protein